jgi:hypothetical protein
MLWQTKYSGPTASTTMTPQDVKNWHSEARRLTTALRASDNYRVLFVLVAHRSVTSSGDARTRNACLSEIDKYVQEVGDFVFVSRERMHEYLPGISHRLDLPLQAAVAQP